MLDDLEFNLSIIRHGESEVNARVDEMGQKPDTALTSLGREQAKKLGSYLKSINKEFDVVFSSPYVRALDTAKLASNVDPEVIVVCDDLREYDAGDWVGFKRAEILTNKVKMDMNILNGSFLPPNGESLSQVERRASQWLEDKILYNKNILRLSKFNKERDLFPINIAVFSHGLTIKCLLHHIMGFERSMTWKVNIYNTSVTNLSFNKNGWFVNSVNDCSHLL